MENNLTRSLLIDISARVLVGLYNNNFFSFCVLDAVEILRSHIFVDRDGQERGAKRADRTPVSAHAVNVTILLDDTSIYTIIRK